MPALSRITLLRWGLPFAAILVLVLVYSVAWLAPGVGLAHDDGIYAVTAKALAEGQGYTIISLPRAIAQTKYPFLFPITLAAVWRMAPTFPQNVFALKAVPLAFACAWFSLTYVLLIRLHATRRAAFWIALLTASSPLVVFCSTNLLSETMFATFFTATLICAHRLEHSPSDRLSYATGFFAALAFLSRSAGIALLVGVPIALVIRRRFAALVRFTVVAGLLASTWAVWIWLHPAALSPTDVYYSSGNYHAWNIVTGFSPGEKVRIFVANSVLSFLSPGLLLGVDPSASLWLIPPMVGCLALLVISRRLFSIDSVSLSVATYLGVILCWAWPPPRFIAVVLPFILLALWASVKAVATTARARQAATALAVLLISTVLVNDLRRIPVTKSTGCFAVTMEPVSKWSELQKIFVWLRSNTKPDAVVVTNLDPAFYLYTGRKAVRSVSVDAYKLLYAPDSPRDDATVPLARIISAQDNGYFVLTPDMASSEGKVLHRQLERYMALYPGKLQLIERPGADSRYQVFRIMRSGNGGETNLSRGSSGQSW